MSSVPVMIIKHQDIQWHIAPTSSEVGKGQTRGFFVVNWRVSKAHVANLSIALQKYSVAVSSLFITTFYRWKQIIIIIEVQNGHS
jgi:hypothetical protein